MVNGFSQVAHNYERGHPFNLWFVVATEAPEDIQNTLFHRALTFRKENTHEIEAYDRFQALFAGDGGFAPMVTKGFEVRPGEAFRSRYRFFAYDGLPDSETNRRVDRDYSEPPTVEMDFAP